MYLFTPRDLLQNYNIGSHITNVGNPSAPSVFECLINLTISISYNKKLSSGVATFLLQIVKKHAPDFTNQPNCSRLTI